MTKEVEVLGKEKAEALQVEARNAYSQMQKSWLWFANALRKIKDDGAYKTLGAKSFHEFCSKEYPSMHYSTIVKTIRVSEVWGKDLEAKIEKDPEYKLPAYESCYQLITVEKKVSESDLKSLKKDVLIGKLSYTGLREKLKSVIEKKKAEIAKEVEENVEDMEAELVGEIETDKEFEDIDMEVDAASGDELVTQIAERVQFLNEHIPNLQLKIEAESELITDQVVELGSELDTLSEKTNNFLNKLEELSQ